ncbi:hypothetical protein [uncultured Paludibaculum sp.]|uniref:hypothetical protein n=1 Tax=uncultured Paludibaculum sp. TaxID=1765020 RepID=UPI002AAC4D74|nr:hypothetical protein [uncultured Paludibaculum sp.]
MRFSLILLLALSNVASAQIVSLGIKAGVPLTDIPRRQATPFFANSALIFTDTGRWTVGPTIEFRLPANLAIEVDALFRGFRGGSAGPEFFFPSGQALLVVAQQDVKAIDIPILLKYRFPGHTMRPFISVGGTSTNESVSGRISYTCLSAESCYPPGVGPFLGGEYSGASGRGGYTGATGAEFRFHRLKIAPELRYTRVHRPASNQVSILVGLSF